MNAAVTEAVGALEAEIETSFRLIGEWWKERPRSVVIDWDRSTKTFVTSVDRREFQEFVHLAPTRDIPRVREVQESFREARRTIHKRLERGRFDERREYLAGVLWAEGLLNPLTGHLEREGDVRERLVFLVARFQRLAGGFKQRIEAAAELLACGDGLPQRHVAGYARQGMRYRRRPLGVDWPDQAEYGANAKKKGPQEKQAVEHGIALLWSRSNKGIKTVMAHGATNGPWLRYFRLFTSTRSESSMARNIGSYFLRSVSPQPQVTMYVWLLPGT